MRRLSKEEFIEKARSVHGGKYDYSKVEYVNSRTNVCIICPEHGEFWQRPTSHLRGENCPKCAFRNRTDGQRDSAESFIKKSIKIHGDKYDYSKVEYNGQNEKVCIICPEHGEFWQTPKGHLNGNGCPLCWAERRGKTRLSNTEEFIKKAKAIHGDKYMYDKVNYTKKNEKVIITCPIHGDFLQTPNDHLHGYGCSKCGIISRAKKKTKNTDYFVKRAKETHGNKYDYSKVEYKGAIEKVCIICPEHGEFWQTPNTHLNGHGCPMCKQSKLELEVSKFLSETEIDFTPQKRFEWMGEQSLDFYLPEHNIAIECQGIQHFEPIGFFGGENALITNKERDERKRLLCEDNDIKVIYYFEDERYFGTYANEAHGIEELKNLLR